MIYLDDELPCAQCDCMVNESDLDGNGLCADCAEENGLVSEVIEDQPKWIDKLQMWNESTSFSS